MTMTQREITFRPANPTLEEGLVCGRHLDETAEGFFSIMLGKEAVKILAEAYTQPGHSYSYENVTFAEIDGEIVGMSLGFTAKQHRAFTDAPLKKAAGKQAFRMRLVKALMAPMVRVLDTIADGDYYILSIGIDKAHRGKGIGTALLDEVEAQAAKTGSQRLALDVAAGNKGAKKLYERRSMTVESKWPKRLPLGKMALFRMTKPL